MAGCDHPAHIRALANARDRGGYVMPRFAAVAGYLDVSVVGAGPDHPGAFRRFADAGDARELLDTVVTRERIFVGNFAQNGLFVALDSRSEIGAEPLPRVAAVGGLEQMVAAVIEGLRIVW